MYLYADEESQRLGSLAPSRLSDADTESLVREAFTQPGLTLNKLTVTTDQALGDAAQEVRAWFGVPDLAAANQYLVPDSLTDFIKQAAAHEIWHNLVVESQRSQTHEQQSRIVHASDP
ncbi:MAG: hypothetical protein IT317_00950, partial [Anaerolineales bacterium]|nr:hypothetical protein [Anaerolineales bacterium]